MLFYDFNFIQNRLKHLSLRDYTVTTLVDGGAIYNYLFIGIATNIAYRVYINTQNREIKIMVDKGDNFSTHIGFEYGDKKLVDTLRWLKNYLMEVL